MIALARKYRPRRFADLLVQDHVATALRGAVARGRVGHGYLLTGPRGTGKTTAARILAMALNCDTPAAQPPSRRAAEPGEPCGECTSCERIWSGAATLDVVEIDAASNRGVDDARDLRERAMYAASQEGRHKVYIIDEAHMLTREAWNALLKILEEPPPGVVFVFATTEPQKIASTAAPVLSRLQRFDFRRIGPAAIKERLAQVLTQEGLAAEPDALAVIARYADGGMRDALSVLDQALSFGEGPVTAAGIRQVLGLIGDEEYSALLRAVTERDTGAVFPLVDRLVNAGADLAEFMTGAADLLRAVLMVETGVEPEGLTDTQRQAIAAARGKLAPADIVRMLGFLADAETGIRRSASARLIVETLLLRWTVMDRIVDLESVIRGRRPVADRPASPMPPNLAAPPKGAPALAPALSPVGPAGSSPADWPEFVAAARNRSRLLGQGLDVSTPEVVGDSLVLWVDPTHAVLAEGLKQKLSVIQELLATRTAEPLRVRVEVGVAREGKPMQPNDLEGVDRDRIRGLDPALDVAADELDLEIVEDRLPERPKPSKG